MIPSSRRTHFLKDSASQPLYSSGEPFPFLSLLGTQRKKELCFDLLDTTRKSGNSKDNNQKVNKGMEIT